MAELYIVLQMMTTGKYLYTIQTQIRFHKDTINILLIEKNNFFKKNNIISLRLFL